MSFLKLLIRTMTHISIINVNPPPALELPEDYRKTLVKISLYVVIWGNLFCIFLHLVFGVYTDSPTKDGYLHGGITVQFIGERFPYSRFELIALDLLVFLTQLVFHNLIGVVKDSEVLESKVSDDIEEDQEQSGSGKFHNEGDGYNGNVHLLTIDILDSIKKVREFKVNLQPMNTGDGANAAQMPGSFPNPRMFV
ncbi:hypothetical protein G210_2096 [Candida maltosa Xu316]|uniref:DUF1746 domain-containing protein n=1 Tax=Candida maltosa (strain Xu316) TaxID=1245528 RepID=M3HSQ6_CANMX|nr:hypothetical protein G210_2096 [Candida maltosa Xu316]